jgi:hypothetical protein
MRGAQPICSILALANQRAVSTLQIYSQQKWYKQKAMEKIWDQKICCFALSKLTCG